LDVKKYVGAELAKLTSAADAIQKAAPAADDDGWNAESDAAAVADMRKAWKQARTSYERIEGSIAVLFAGLDVSTDERYDGFIESEPDENLFDDQGVIGIHAIERVLWSDATPERVVKFEKALDGYKEAAFPKTKDEAEAYKNKLCARLVKDTKKMRDDFSELALDSTSAFRGMIGSVQEQSEKTTKAASGEDESRYSQNTLADMRANLEGARAVFSAFRAWIDDAGNDSSKIDAEFAAINTAYTAVKGDALPEVPEGFNPDDPSDDHLSSPYGKLWNLLQEKTDDRKPDSLVSIMGKAADKMGIPGLTAEE
jgi:iron uptake system component EfeO